MRNQKEGRMNETKKVWLRRVCPCPFVRFVDNVKWSTGYILPTSKYFQSPGHRNSSLEVTSILWSEVWEFQHLWNLYDSSLHWNIIASTLSYKGAVNYSYDCLPRLPASRSSFIFVRNKRFEGLAYHQLTWKQSPGHSKCKHSSQRVEPLSFALWSV